MPNIRLLQTVEDQITTFPGDDVVADTPVPLNAIAMRRGQELSRRDGGETISLVWTMPEGGEFTVGQRQATRLIGLGYAEAI